MSEMRAAKVTVRPATLNRFTAVPIGSKKKRRVAAYARVSTNSEEQATSYEAQVSYYTKHIKSNSEWKFVHVYTDKGITGTNTKKREGFNQMIEDALAGKIDLIITKVRFPLRPQYGGQSHDHPQTESAGYRGIL